MGWGEYEFEVKRLIFPWYVVKKKNCIAKWGDTALAFLCCFHMASLRCCDILKGGALLSFTEKSQILIELSVNSTCFL